MRDLPPVLEIKHQLDGRRQTFLCQGLVLTPWRAVVRFTSSHAIQAADFAIPAGAVTYGFFWRGRNYNLYRIVSPDGDLIAHRFDVITDVRLRTFRQEVEYLDLLLDLWVAPDGAVIVEDEEEVAHYAAQGLLTPSQQQLIVRTRQRLVARHMDIINQSAAELEEKTSQPAAQ